MTDVTTEWVRVEETLITQLLTTLQQQQASRMAGLLDLSLWFFHAKSELWNTLELLDSTLSIKESLSSTTRSEEIASGEKLIEARIGRISTQLLPVLVALVEDVSKILNIVWNADTAVIEANKLFDRGRSIVAQIVFYVEIIKQILVNLNSWTLKDLQVQIKALILGIQWLILITRFLESERIKLWWHPGE